MPKKSLSQQRKEVRSHVGALKQAAHRIGTSVAVYDLYDKELGNIKNAKDFESWYRRFAKRVGAQIAQDSSEAAFMRDQLHSIESILGLRI